MKKSLLISEQDSIAALLENERVVEFFVNRGELLLGDIYSATVENILPGIDAAFVNLGKDKMGFLHANDVPGQGPLKERLVPKQKLLVQITKEPTGHKGPRVSTAISLPGRFLVLVPEERGVSISRRISEARERARLKAVVNLMKPPGVGLIIRTEAKGQGEGELFDDFEALWDRWQTVVSEGEASIGPTLIYRDQDLLYRVIRDAYSHDVTEIICDTTDGQQRAQEYLQGWAGKTTRVTTHPGDDSLLVSRGVDREIEAALSDRAELPSGGHLNIQPTEALTVIDVNSGRFTSSRTQAETVRRTNLEAAQEIPRQLRLRNIGGMVIVDFIDMDSRKDQQQVLEVFQRVLEEDRAKPQVGQLSDLGLVELTRRRQGQSLRELFTAHCTQCSGHGVTPTLELGPAHDRRAITFKLKDDEPARGRNNRNKMGSRGTGNSQLRAASASHGRVMPAAVEEEVPDVEHDFDDVPEEILAQMPDDLLQNEQRAPGGQSTKRGAFVESDDDDLEDGEEATFVVQNTQNFAPSRAIFEETVTEDEDSVMHNDLTESISAVEQVYQDMGARARVTVDEQAPVHDSVEVIATEPVEAKQVEVKTEPVPAVEPDTYKGDTGNQTEYDPVTGVYRLKVKSAHEEADDHHNANGEAHHVESVSEEHAPTDVDAQSDHSSHGHSSAHSVKSAEEQLSLFPREMAQMAENVETLADEYENRTPEWQAETADESEADEAEHVSEESASPSHN